MPVSIMHPLVLIASFCSPPFLVEDCAGVRAVIEASRHAAVAVEGGYRASNPGQRWTTTFDGRGFPTESDGQEGVAHRAYLKASNAEGKTPDNNYYGDVFGYAVSLSGETLVVGAPFEASSATGLNGDQSDNNASSAGAVYVFVRTGSTWTQQAYLKASNPDADDYFGISVSVSGDTIVAGAIQEASQATGVNGDESDNSAYRAGAAYVFVRNGTTWSQEAYLKASNAEGRPDNSAFGDWFGYSVCLSGDSLVVGAMAEQSNATGVNGDQNDNSLSGAGAAYVFVRDGTTWTQEAYLKAPQSLSCAFGFAVAMAGDQVVVGARWESWVEIHAGAAHVYARSGTSWSHESYLRAGYSYSSEWFGSAVAVFDEAVVVGAPGEAGGSTGVGGDQSDKSAEGSGAVYVYDFERFPPGTGFCFGDLGSGACPCGNDNDGSVPGSGCANGAFASGAHLTGTGIESVSADTVVLTTTGLVPGNPCLYFQANDAPNGGAGVIFGDGLRCTGGALIRLQSGFADAFGASATTVSLAERGGVKPGDVKRYQCWYGDDSGAQPCGVGVNDFNLTNGFEIAWLP